jgi:alkylation response protein AidB-like acyl-CoA dehydrogenase
MELALSSEDVAFQAAAREWLLASFPTERRPNDGQAMREFDLEWQRRQWAGGWAGVSWPSEFGGRGLPLLHQLIWLEECARVGAPDIDSRFVAVNHAGPTLIANGTEEQKTFHLPKILRGEVLWCQGFSEPQAGSDLASLRTTGVIDGDDLVVNGQKLWTSFADLADYQELLVRTDPESGPKLSVPKHRGLTWVICDMRLPGITIRPIKTLDGLSHFCEVFYDDVRIPLSNVVGAVNDGWRVAMSTLSFERGTAFTHGQVQLASIAERLVAHSSAAGVGETRPELVSQLATARAEVAALRALTYLNAMRNAGQAVPGPEGSLVKLCYTELRQRLMRLALEIVGPGSDLPGITDATWDEDYLFSYTETIAGGTSDIQRNIIGERVLGLPR